MRWLLIEPYYGGSHRHLVDLLRRELAPDSLLWTLPARKWKWRMRGAAPHFAARFAQDRPTVDAIFTSSLLNVAELRGLLPASARTIPITLYFHENQLAYPVQHADARDHHFAFTNLLSALAADRVLWNSQYNRDSFADGCRALMRKMPDYPLANAVEQVLEKSELLPVPIDDLTFDRPRPTRAGPCHVVWNHRWEYDKGPDTLLECMQGALDSGEDFEVSILGQGFRSEPGEMGQLKRALGSRVRQWGFLESHEAYLDHLASADVALSTARHDFQGLSILEAAARGAVPLVPDGLAYREIWPARYRAAANELPTALVERLRDASRWREEDPMQHAQAWRWTRLRERWRDVFDG